MDCSGLAPVAERALRPPRPGAFRPLGVAHAEPSVHNPHVEALPGGGSRLYCHRVGEILGALSPDGLHFVFDPLPLLRGSMPATERLPDGGWRMYYSGADGQAMRSALSPDGQRFTDEGERLAPGPPGSWDELGQVHLAPLRLPDGRLRVFYDAQAPAPAWVRQIRQVWRTTSAVSEDGLSFRREPGRRIDRDAANRQPNIQARGVRFWFTWSVAPQYRDGRFYLYTTAVCLPAEQSGIWRASSTNGLDFVLDSEPSLCAADLDGALPEDPSLVVTPEGERLYYWVRDQGTAVAFRPWSEAPEPDGVAGPPGPADGSDLLGPLEDPAHG